MQLPPGALIKTNGCEVTCVQLINITLNCSVWLNVFIFCGLVADLATGTLFLLFVSSIFIRCAGSEASHLLWELCVCMCVSVCMCVWQREWVHHISVGDMSINRGRQRAYHSKKRFSLTDTHTHFEIDFKYAFTCWVYLLCTYFIVFWFFPRRHTLKLLLCICIQ